jgi:predicted dehydrogenase
LAVKYSDFAPLARLARERSLMLMENQQFRFHSSIRRIRQLVDSGQLGDLLEVQICISLNITARGSPYVDRNVPHFGTKLPGGVIGDFLPHIAYLALMFAGPISDLRTIWTKHKQDTPLNADEFRGFLSGRDASVYVSFSGNARPEGFLVRLIGTRMRVEANLFEPPRLTIKRSRKGEPALMTLVDGIAEARDVFRGSVAGLCRKLGGTSSYDGLQGFIAEVYRTLATKEEQPVALEEIGRIALLAERLAERDLRI